MLGSIFADLYLHSFDPIQFCFQIFGAVLVGETKNIPPARHTQTHVWLESDFRDDCNKILPFLKHMRPDIEMLQLLTDTLRKGDILTNMEKFNHAEILTHWETIFATCANVTFSQILVTFSFRSGAQQLYMV